MIDFVTALGRVLHDGSLRDAFVADPVAFVRGLGLMETDRDRFLRLVPADLEFQARVLLRKRFVLVRDVLPRTCENLGDDAWPEFLRHGRAVAPRSGAQTAEDAFGFSLHLMDCRPGALCPVEFNRCRFVREGSRIALHLVPSPRRARLPSIQVLFRRGPRRWREWRVSLAV